LDIDLAHAVSLFRFKGFEPYKRLTFLLPQTDMKLSLFTQLGRGPIHTAATVAISQLHAGLITLPIRGQFLRVPCGFPAQPADCIAANPEPEG
jgi:hypothetical protein